MGWVSSACGRCFTYPGTFAGWNYLFFKETSATLPLYRCNSSDQSHAAIAGIISDSLSIDLNTLAMTTMASAVFNLSLAVCSPAASTPQPQACR